jgi:6-phosphogluconolactonase/glucosamine-6-phosphate isomerase/deaminase
MQIHTTDNPAKLLGEELSEHINTHDGDVVCILSGGSALDIIEFIQISDTRECRTMGSTSQNIVEQSSPYFECRTIFMMGDERWSRDRAVNNSLQLQTRFPGHPASESLIETIPGAEESLVDFATRIQKTFLEKISALRNPKIFMILGMGTDGHTAGIFPMSKESFQSIYQDDLTYVPVHVAGLTIDSRASLTPGWILSQVDALYAYVVGESKHAMLESLKNETKELHERPAELLKRHQHVHLYTDQAF